MTRHVLALGATVWLVASPAFAQREPRGWFALRIGSAWAGDHRLKLDLRASPDIASETLGAGLPLCDLASLQVEWGVALTDPSGISAQRAWTLGNPYVGLATILGTLGVAFGSGDRGRVQHGDRLLLHHGGRDPWLYMAHRGAIAYEVTVGAEVGHPDVGRLVVELRMGLAYMLAAADDGSNLGYVGETFDAFYEYGIFRIGLTEHTSSLSDHRSSISEEAYLGMDVDGLFVRLGATSAHDESGGQEWTSTLSLSGSFE